jgi:hypothetical protein
MRETQLTVKPARRAQRRLMRETRSLTAKPA